MNAFTKAHKMTKEIIQAGDNYAATFALCLKYVHAKPVKKVVTALDVYAAMQDANENGYVYLDNVDLDALGINAVQFSGFCSALTRCGLYRPHDANFGKLID